MTDKERIAELEKELQELKDKYNFLKNQYHNVWHQLANYRTEKYDLGIRVEEIMKRKFDCIDDKTEYFKGFNNCEQQCASHIVDLQDEIKVLEKALDIAVSPEKYILLLPGRHSNKKKFIIDNIKELAKEKLGYKQK